MDVPNECALQADGNEDDDQDGEQYGLVVEHGDGLRRGTNLGEKVELTHDVVCVVVLEVGSPLLSWSPEGIEWPVNGGRLDRKTTDLDCSLVRREE